MSRRRNPRRLAGYRLHRARLERAQNRNVVRTHKYPLGSSANELECLWSLVAPLAAALNRSGPGTLIHFLVVALGQGGVIASKSTVLEQYLETLYPGRVHSVWGDWGRTVCRFLPGDAESLAERPWHLAKFLLTVRRKSAGRSDTSIPNGVKQEWAELWGAENDEKLTARSALDFKNVLESELRAGKSCNAETLRACFERQFSVTLPELPAKRGQDAPSFALLPDQPFVEHSMSTVLLEHIRPLAERLGEKEDALIGTSENQNGLSAFWGKALVAFQAGDQAAFDYVDAATHGLWRGNEDELARRLQPIREAAMAIPADAGPMASGWHEYRALVGGRVQSWTTNFLKRVAEFEIALGTHGDRWRALNDSVDWSQSLPLEEAAELLNPDRLRSLAERSDELRRTFAGSNSGTTLVSRAEFNAYDEEYRVVRERLEYLERVGFDPANTWLPKGLRTKRKEGREGEPATVPDREFLTGDAIPPQLPRYPIFIGEARELSEERLKDAWNQASAILSEADTFVSELLATDTPRTDSEFWSEDTLRRQLDGLLRLANAAGPAVQARLVTFLSTWTTARRQDLTGKELAFYVSPYARKRRTPLTLRRAVPDYAGFIREVESVFPELVSPDPVAAFETLFADQTSGRGGLIEFAELKKRYWGLRLLSLSAAPELKPLPPVLSSLPAARFLTDPTRSAVQRAVQAGYGAELRGCMSLLSRAFYTERAVLQTTNGEQTQLAYIPRATKPGWKLVRRWAELLERHGIDPNETPEQIATAIWAASKPAELLPVLSQLPHGWGAVLRERKNKRYPSELDRSRQATALTFAKSTDGAAHNLSVEKDVVVLPVRTSRYQTQFMERFLASATGSVAGIGLQGGSLIFERERALEWQRSDSGMSLVRRDGEISAYFAIPWELRASAKRGAAPEMPPNILGIDLGEYGFGWAVVTPAGALVDSGFVAEHRLARIRRTVTAWKDQQSRGTFVRPTTRLERMREAAVGRIRNEIHALALRHDAYPVYEYEVSRFEVGSARLRKLYSSLKRADVPGGGDADVSLAKNLWGSSKHQGRQIGAAYTSQTCRSCGRSASWALGQAAAEVSAVRDGKFQLDGPHAGELRVELSDGVHSIKDLAGAVRDALRGRGEGYGSSQDEFTCPYLDCGNRCHADQQAAHNIALKHLWHSGGAQGAKKKRSETEQDTGASLRTFMERSPMERPPGVAAERDG